MTVYHDPEKRNRLTCERRGKRKNLYCMEVGGWYGGKFSASSDTEAHGIFSRILKESEV